MQRFELPLPQEIYATHLQSLSDINFSARQIDIIAFIISGRSTKKIASILAIAPKTVENTISVIMKKLRCNTREGIIDFVEKSGKYAILKMYYSTILQQVSFEDHLRKFSLLIEKETVNYVVFSPGENDIEKVWVPQIEKHLKIAGIKTSLANKIQEACINERVKNPNLKNIMRVIAVGNNQPEKTKKDPTLPSLTNSESFKEHFSNSIYVIDDPKLNGSRELIDEDTIIISKNLNYYNFIFQILTRLKLNSVCLDKIIAEFNAQNIDLNSFITITNTPLVEENIKPVISRNNASLTIINNSRLAIWLGGLLIIGLFTGGLYYLSGGDQTKLLPFHTSQNNEKIITSDLILPSDKTLLLRPKVMAKINSCLTNIKGIQTLALVGVGGSGKSTMARYYASLQKPCIRWEINAENHESLINSFELLAYELARSDEEKKSLKMLEDIKVSKEREAKFLSFIKKKLKSCNNWLLIFDNAEKFTDIQHYLPNDLAVWGKGIVIITTIDSNIQNNNHIHTIQVEELETSEKFELFNKIYHSAVKQPKADIENFLNSLPPFPLDISLAAYYLKAHGISFEKYISRLNESSNDFEISQSGIIKEVNSDYDKTRYRIIALSLRHLLAAHPDFGSLLLFINLLDTQNIPVELLATFKNEVVVDDFIYHLKNYSLLTNQSLKSARSFPTISIHRSTQKPHLSYLIKELNLEKDGTLQESIFQVLDSYIAKNIELEDLQKMKIMAVHCKTLLTHKKLLNPSIIEAIESRLGIMYAFLGDYKQGAKLLEASTKNKHRQEITLAECLEQLGNIYTELGNFDESKKHLERSLAIYKENPQANISKIARALSGLGNVYRKLGDYEKATSLLKESLDIYNKHYSSNHSGVARTLMYLGSVYTKLGQFEESKTHLERSLSINEKYYPENYANIARTQTYLACAYFIRGDCEPARQLLEKSLKLYREKCPERHLGIARTLGHLGYAYHKLDYNKEAKAFFIESLKIYKQHYNGEHVEVARILVCLGNMERLLGDYPTAKKLIEEGLNIFKKYYKNEHVDVGWASGHLGFVYRHYHDYEKSLALMQQNLAVNMKIFGPHNVMTASVIRHIGKTYLYAENLEAAAVYIKQALNIFNRNSSIEIYRCLDDLAEIDTIKFNRALEAGEIQRAQEFKQQAITNLKQALKITMANFPPQSPVIKTLQTKLDKLTS